MVGGIRDAEQKVDTVLFRPSKKRKTYRKRADEETEDTISPIATPAPSTIDDLIARSQDVPDIEATTVPVSEILRIRKLRKAKGGVEFRVASTKKNESDELAVRAPSAEEETPEDGAVRVGRRFAPQTGTVGDVNKHM